MTASQANPEKKKNNMVASPPIHDLTGKFGGISLQSNGNRSSGAKSWRTLNSVGKAQTSPISNSVTRSEQHARGLRSERLGGDAEDPKVSKEQWNRMRMSMIRRKKDFKHMERVKGRMVNIVEGLELHTGVFKAEEQKKIVQCVYEYQEQGRAGKLRERTYSEPMKWMRGKGRVTIQFGCCYNYAMDKDGNPPGIIRSEEVDPIPPLLKDMIKRMVEWHVIPPTCVPNSCIVNIYDKDDCIPPHIDHHDFLRPFCTVSFLAECSILFGTELKVLGPGEFLGSVAIPLPLGSVLILNGNGANVAKHCVPAVPAKRISITFRKMDEKKIPYAFLPDLELQKLRPFAVASTAPLIRVAEQQTTSRAVQAQKQSLEEDQSDGGVSVFSHGDFPPLSSSTRRR